MEIVNISDQLQWNPRRGPWKKRNLNIIKEVILHQELGNADVYGVHHYHTNYDSRGAAYGRNWPKFAYHFGIHTDGTIYQCNELTDISWHTKRHNTQGVGIMLVGNFSGPGWDGNREPTAEQRAAYFWLAEELLNQFPNQLTRQNFHTHANFGKPACPGYVAAGWVEEFRTGGGA